MFTTAELSSGLRGMMDLLQGPVILVLMLLMALTVVLLGTLAAELILERIHMKAKLPALMDELRAGQRPMAEIIDGSGLLKRQRKALHELTAHPQVTGSMREALAVRLLHQEKQHYDLLVMLSDITAKVAPMFGLLGTLIPLGPGIIALGRGDTYTLSTSLLTAFDTTAAGLVAAAAAFFISAVRRRWYANYMSALEMSMECMLEMLASPEKKEGEADDR